MIFCSSRTQLVNAGTLEQFFNSRTRLDLNSYVTVTARYVNAAGSPLSKPVLFAALEQTIRQHPALSARLPPPGPDLESVTTSTDAAQPRVTVVGMGVSKLSHPLVAGRRIKASMTRHGTVVAERAPSWEEFQVRGTPKTYNFNVYVAMSD